MADNYEDPILTDGAMYGYSKKSSDQAFERNKDFLDGNYFVLTVKKNDRKSTIICLTGEEA